MSRKSLLIILLATICAASEGKLPDYRFRHYRVEDGMSTNTVFKVMQDSDGLMWFGTSDGLIRYDGHGFKSYRNDPGDNQTISNVVYSLAEGKPGLLYIGTENGLLAFDKRQESFEYILHDIHVRSIARDTAGVIWIATLGQGIYRYDDGDVAHYNTKCNKELTSNYVPCIICDERNEIWCVNADKWLYHYEPAVDDFSRRIIADGHKGQEENKAFSLCCDHLGNIWIGGWDKGIFMYDRENKTFTGHMSRNGKAIHNGRIHTIREISPGIIGYGCDYGFVIVDISNDEYRTFHYRPDEPWSMSDNFVYDIMRDREGGIWVSTYFGGINYTHQSNSLFSFGMTDKTGKRGRIISRFRESRTGVLWIGTDDAGLFRYDRSRGDCMEIVLDENIRNLNIHALLEDGQNLWIGTYSNGLYRMNLNNGKVTHWSDFGENAHATDIPNGESIYALYKDSQKRLWIGTKKGVTIMENGKFTSVADLGFNCDIIEIQGDDYGNIWCASINKGLYKYTPGSGTLKSIKSGADDSRRLPDETISIQVSKDVIWIGTAGNGLFRYNIRTEQLEQISDSETLLSSQSIYHIVCENDNVWLNTSRGLVRYNVQSRLAKRFGVEDGLKTNIFNNNSGILTSDGTIFLGCNGGFNWFRPSDIVPNIIHPQIYHEGIELSGAQLSLQQTVDALKNGNLETFKNHSQIRLKFAASSYISPQTNRYRWHFGEGEAEWTEITGSNGIISPGKLKKGSHLICVEAGNNDGYWSSPYLFRIKVKTHWYGSTCMWIIYAIAIMSILLLLSRLWLGYRKEKRINMDERLRREHDKARLDTELELFTNIAKEIRTPVMLINGPANEILSDNGLSESTRRNAVIIKKSSDKLFGITHDILNFLRSSIEIRGEEFQIEEPLSGKYHKLDAEIKNSIKTELGKQIADNESSSGGSRSMRQICILIVDGNQDIHDFLDLSLSKYYRTLLHATDKNGAESLLHQNQRVDIIISDVQEGLWLCENIKKEEQFCHIPVILMSSDDGLNQKKMALEKGADIFLEKPVNISYLVAQIDNILDKRKIIWDSFSRHPYSTLRATAQGKGDEMFLSEISRAVAERMHDINFTVDDLAREMHLSRSMLFEKMKDICGTTPNNFIKEMRLRKAASLLAEQKYRVNEICWMVGFNTPSYFAKSFLKYFGVLPKDFMK